MRARLMIVFLSGLVFSLLISHESLAKKTLLLEDTKTVYAIDSNYFECIKWKHKTSYDSAIVLPNDRIFPYNASPKEDYWFRLKVTNNNTKLSEWILVCYFYSIDEFDMLVEDSLGRIENQFFRDTMDISSREIRHRQPSFLLTIKPHETKTIYIKIKNESTYDYKFGIFSPFGFFSSSVKEYFLVGLFYGLMLFVLIYSLINYIVFRDSVVLIYIFFILSQTIHMLFRDGNGSVFLPIPLEYADLIKNLSRASISVFVLLYTIHFLKLKKSGFVYTFAILYIILRIIYAAVVLENTYSITFYLELFAILFSTGLSIKAFLHDKYTDAKYMVIGLSLISISYFIFYLSVVWLPVIGSFGFYIMYFGIAGECIFTTLALTERYKRIKLENFQKDQISHELERAVAESTALVMMQNKLLEEQSSELNSFLYSASHDLSGPIKSIEGLINIAIIDPTANLKELYNMMKEQLVNLENNVTDLNSVSIIRNKGKNLKEINFETIHSEVTKIFSTLIDSNRVSIFFQSTVEKNFQDDYFTIKTIYHHLLENAIKFRDANKQSFLKITVSEKNNRIFLIFEDNGIGIEKSQIANIFKMFFRGTENTKNDTGLGLYIVQLAVKKLNGEIEVESVLGEGSTFRVSFSI
jgi:signal transduction histidine kinase